jgi:L-threonylcarbamoyladenylate synthase
MTNIHKIASVSEAVSALMIGDVIAYPTEAVFGLGCDPDNEQAIKRLLALKQRPEHKGLIIIAADISQLLNYVSDDQISNEMWQRVRESWPGPVTWLMPAQPSVSALLKGAHETLAVRVTAHPVARQLCELFGKPIVSTSANIAGANPARSVKELNQQFNDRLSCIVDGDINRDASPSEIRDLASNKVIRKSI